MIAQRSEPVFFVRLKPPPQVKRPPPVPNTPRVKKAQKRLAEARERLKDFLTATGGGPAEVESADQENVRMYLAWRKEVRLAEGEYAAAVATARKALKPPAPEPPKPIPDLTESITTFEFEEDEKKADQLTLTIKNEDLSYFDSPLFEKGTTLHVGWGYAGALAPTREVVVQKVTGARMLKVVAQSKSVLMNKLTRVRTFENKTRSEVARIIAAENGYGPSLQDIDESGGGTHEGVTMTPRLARATTALKAAKSDLAYSLIATDGGPAVGETTGADAAYHIGMARRVRLAQAEYDAAYAEARKLTAAPIPPSRHAVLSQAAQTDAQFLKRLADQEGFEFYVDFDGFHFHKRRFKQRPVRVLQYFLPPDVGDIVDFDVENDVTAKPGAVNVKGRDPLTKKSIDAKADNASSKRDTLAPFIEVDGVTGVKTAKMRIVAAEETRTTTETDPKAAKAEADAIFRRTQQTAVQLTLKLVGDPYLVAKTVVEVRGLGKRLSGKYYIASLKHTISGSGYSISAKTKTDGTGSGAAKSKGTANKAEPAKDAEKGKLTPFISVDKATGVKTTIYRDTRGRTSDAPTTKAG